MTAQLSRERLEQYAEHGAERGYNRLDLQVMARMALAGLDSEPVAQQPELAVWYGSMPESNGKTNWTAILHRKGEGKCFDGFTIDRSEYPGRVRYAADRVRYLIGELPERPHLLDYDGDEHSGYTAPPAPVAVPGHADCCPECGSKSLTWDVTVAKTSDVVQGRLRTSDVTGMFFLGCDECSETVSNVRMENIAVFLNACRAAMLKAGPVTAAALPDGWKLVPVEPTAEMCKAGYEAQDKWPSEQCDNFKERHYSFSQPRYKAMLAAAPAAPEQEV